MENLNNGNTDLKYLDNSHCVQVPAAGNSCSSVRNWNWLHIICPRNYHYFLEQTGLFSFLIKKLVFWFEDIPRPSWFLQHSIALLPYGIELKNSTVFFIWPHLSNLRFPLDTSLYTEIILSHHLKQTSLANKLFFLTSITEYCKSAAKCISESGLSIFSVELLRGKYLLVNICYCVHPAPNAHLIADIRWVTEFMNYANMVWIRATKYLLLKSQCVNLWKKANKDV